MYMPHKNESGFTLVELMITVAIGAVLLGVALPNYQDMVKNNCMTATTNSLIANLQLARSEAIKRNQNIRLVANVSGWGLGWTIQSPTNVVIRDVSLTCSQTTLTESGGSTTLTYKPSGFIDDPATFTVCDDRTAETGRRITINAVGRPNTDPGFTCS